MLYVFIYVHKNLAVDSLRRFVISFFPLVTMNEFYLSYNNILTPFITRNASTLKLLKQEASFLSLKFLLHTTSLSTENANPFKLND